MEKLTVDKFEGGIVDGYLEAPGNRASVMDNLLLDPFGKPYTRNGITCFGTRLPTSITANLRVSGTYVSSEPWTRPVCVSGGRAFNLSETDAWTEILGPAVTSAYPGKVDVDLEAATLWRKQIIADSPAPCLPTRIYCTQYTAPTAFTALTLGLPRIGTPTVTSSGGAGHNYIYSFHYYYTFTDYEGTVFAERGAVVNVQILNAGVPSVNVVHITAIPVLANTAYTNYDTAALKVEIFRTTDKGTVSYFIGEITNGTTTYDDSATDASIVTATPIYTNGGLLEYNQPPVGSKYVTEVNDFFWHASDSVLTHSIQGAPGACPSSYQQPQSQKVMGLNNVISFPILFCEKSVYRIEGVFDEQGNGGFEPREISKTAGCISNRSIVAIPGGLVWAGNGSFYFTDGDKVEKLSCGFNERYAAMVDPSMTGAYDPENNLVCWTINGVQSPLNYLCSDSVIFLHLNFGISPYSTFTTGNGQGAWFPSSLAYTNAPTADSRFLKKLLIGERRGYLMSFDPAAYTDPVIDTGAEIAAFKRKAIIYTYDSLGMDLGDDATRKYAVELTAELRDDTNISCQFFTRKDDGGPWAQFSEIRTDGAILWEISDVSWNDPNDPYAHDWNSQIIAEGKRQFPAQTLRATRRQIRLTNSKTWLARSDDASTATVVAATRRITLNGAGSWPSDCEDYEIAFTGDLYVATWIVKNRVSDTVIEVFDPLATLVNVSTKWQMRGYRKNERMYLLSYTVHFQNEGTSQAANRGVASYVNA